MPTFADIFNQQHIVRSLRWLRFFRIELFFGLFIFAVSFEDVTLTLLAQDKICMEHFDSNRFCANLSKVGSDSTGDDPQLLRYKDQVLAEVTTFNFYQSLIYTIPVIFGSFFIGSWADRHQSSTKTLVILASLMVTLESTILFFNAVYFYLDVNLMLIAYVLFPLVGGGQSLGMVSISYLSATTTADNRVIRFIILDVIRIVASSMGGFCGGMLIGTPKLTRFAEANGQLHNYDLVLAIAVLIKLVGFLYATLMPFQKRTKSDQTIPLLIGDTGSKEEETKVIVANSLKSKQSRSKLSKFKANLCDLFVLQNVRESFEVCFRPRENGVRATLWMLLISMAIFAMVARSAMVLLFQFVQKLYNWDAGQYSKWNSMLYMSTHLFGFLVVTPVLTKVFKISDSTLLVIGLVSYIGQKFLCGTVLTETAFCLSYLFGSIGSVAPVAIRSKISKLVPPNELNRIFGLLTTLETISPMIGISLYTFIFNKTISTYPGFVFQLSGFLLLIPLVLTTYIGTKSPMPAMVAMHTTATAFDKNTKEQSSISTTVQDINNNNNHSDINKSNSDSDILIHIIPIQTRDDSNIQKSKSNM